MSSFSPQSQRYIRIFRFFISLYPAKHRAEYGHSILQLFEDQLHDAEKLHDAHIVREVFLHAVLGVPGSLLRETWAELRGATPQSAFAALGPNAWPLTTFAYFVLLGFGLDWFNGPAFLSFGCMIFAVLILFSYVFFLTRRLILSVAVLLTGILTSALGDFIFNSVLPHYSDGSLAVVQLDPLSADFLWMFAFPFVCAYGLAALFHYRADRFRRPDLAQLSEHQIAELKARIVRRRQRTKKISLALVCIFIGMNIVGLYDPPHSHADLNLSIRKIPDQQNMYFGLVKLPIDPSADYVHLDAIQKLYTTNAWDQTKADDYLAGKESLIEQFQQAASKSYYQEPSFADLNQYQTVESVTSIQLADLNGMHEAATLSLLQAESLRRSGATDAALLDTSAVLSAGDAIQSSQASMIENIFGRHLRADALAELSKIVTTSSLTDSQAQAVSRQLATLRPTAPGLAIALKTEYYTNRIIVEHLRPHGLASFLPSPQLESNLISIPLTLPFFFQPNRTVETISNQYRDQLHLLQTSCSPSLATPTTYGDPFTIGARMLRYNGVGEYFSDSTPFFGSQILQHCKDDAQLQDVKSLVQKQMPAA